VKHVDDFETTPLPGDLGREFAADAPCVAVLVEGEDASAAESDAPPAERSGAGDRAPSGRDAPEGVPRRRASVTVYRVGDGYVLDCAEASGEVEAVGMRPGQLSAYVDRVRDDDEWTVLSIAEAGSGTWREDLEGEQPVGR
jgi:hypothetical protein